MNRRQMLEWVMMLGFCAFDMQLYLDTHPCDREALAYYRECIDMYKQAKEKFESNFGPLQASSSMDEENWAWADMPLPWEGVR